MGRPREFDIDKAVGAATHLFWRQGYDGTSLADLTAAMGITPPSFYFAFGSKEALFRTVIGHYVDLNATLLRRAFAEPSARAVAANLLNAYVDLFTDPAHAPGCLFVSSMLTGGGNSPLRDWLDELSDKRLRAIRDRFAAARAAGDLPADYDVDTLVRYLTAVSWGLAVEARSGAPADTLRRTIDIALANWPTA